MSVKNPQAAESEIRQSAKESKSAQWKKENAGAIAQWNEWVKENGLPIKKYWPLQGV